MVNKTVITIVGEACEYKILTVVFTSPRKFGITSTLLVEDFYKDTYGVDVLLNQPLFIVEK